MGKKEFFIGMYCPPAVPAVGLPSRITKEVYSLLKNAGIRHIYGYYEDEAGERYIDEALALCAENKMYFYPRLELFNRYLGMKGDQKFPYYFDFSETEREKFDEEFIRWMQKIKEHPGFGGIFIGDERPYETFDSMGIASRLFAKCCPDKEFHYNALNYFGADDIMFYKHGGDSDREVSLVGDLEYNAENRFNRYKVYLDKYLNSCSTKHLSTDVYPFALTWEKVPTSIHRCLYETSTILATYRKQRNISCYHCVQIGNWDLNSRYIGRAETALHMNISAAYQLDGYIFFPGVFPNDWLYDDFMKQGAHGVTGLLDCTGKPTIHYGYTQRLVEHIQTCAPVLLNADWLGVCTIGSFEGGFDGVNLAEIEWNECIYTGGLPENESFAYTGKLPDIQTSSQLFIGVFENVGDNIYWFTNNSIVTDVNFEVEISGKWSLILDGKTVHGTGTVNITALNAGESVLLIVEK